MLSDLLILKIIWKKLHSCVAKAVRENRQMSNATLHHGQSKHAVHLCCKELLLTFTLHFIQMQVSQCIGFYAYKIKKCSVPATYFKEKELHSSMIPPFILWYLHSMTHNLMSTYFSLVLLSGRGVFHFLEIYCADVVFLGIRSFLVLPNSSIVRPSKI